MYARSALYVAAGALVLGILLGQSALVSLGILGLTTLGIATIWGRGALVGVTYERRLSADHVFWGEQVGVDVTLTNYKLLPLTWLEAEEPVSRKLTFLPPQPDLLLAPPDLLLAHSVALRPFERVHWRYEMTCPARGLYRFGPVTLRSGDPFGLYSREGQQAAPAQLYVYPKTLTLAELGLPPRQPFGDIRASRMLLDDPLRTAGVREYRPTDPFKRVHWKATAHTQQLQVRTYDQATDHTLLFFLNIETWHHIYEGIDGVQAEWAITVVASLARWAAAQGWSFGLHSNSAAADGGEGVRIGAGRSPGQLIRMLEGLARMTIYPIRGFTDLLRSETQNLPLGSTVVVVTPVLPVPLRAALVRLRERRLRLVVCALADDPPPPLPGMTLYHLPAPREAEYLRHIGEVERQLPDRLRRTARNSRWLAAQPVEDAL
ncbi:MAG: DUF58 domain-containing protein [Chloroflexota bacterium]|nr:DUF58 domain-containing protein [Chloroflexota bacterium]